MGIIVRDKSGRVISVSRDVAKTGVKVGQKLSDTQAKRSSITGSSKSARAKRVAVTKEGIEQSKQASTIKQELKKSGYDEKSATQQANKLARVGVRTQDVLANIRIARSKYQTELRKQQRSDDKPYITIGKLLAIQGKRPKQATNVKYFKNEEGKVVGIEDPFAQMSYRIEPTTQAVLDKAFKEKQLEKEFVTQKRNEQRIKQQLDTAVKKQVATKRYEEDKKLSDRYDAIVKRSNLSAGRREKARASIQNFFDVLSDKRATVRGTKSKAGSFQNKFLSEVALFPRDITVGLGEFLGEFADKVTFQLQAVANPNYTKMALAEIGRSTLQSPKTVAQAFDPRTPEGLASIVTMVAFIGIAPKLKIRIKKVKNIPAKTTKFKVGTILQDAKGNLKIVSKNGRTIKVPKARANVLLKAQKKGTPVRAKRTEVARLTQKQLRGKITKAEGKVLTKAQKVKLNKQINKEVNTLTRKFKLNQSEKARFSKIYKEFRKKPNITNARKLRVFENKVEVDQIVRAIDRRIANRLKPKVKPKVVKPKRKPNKKLTPKQEAKKFVKKARAKKKLDIIKARKQADFMAKKKGFKNYKEQFQYEKAFKEYTKGSLKAEKILKKIEANMRARKSKASKIASAKFKKLREKVITEAEAKLRSGDLRIKQEVRILQKSKAKLNKQQKAIYQEYLSVKNKQIKSWTDIDKEQQLLSRWKNSKSQKQKTAIQTIKSGKTQLITKTKVKPKLKTKVRTTKPKYKLKALRGSTTTAIISSASKVLSSTRMDINNANSVLNSPIQKITPSQINLIDTAISNDFKIIQDVINDIDNILSEDITQRQAQDLKQDLRVAQKQKLVLERVLRKITKTKKLLQKLPLKLILPKLSWSKPTPRGYTYIVQPYIKEKGRIKKLGNPTARNRGLKRARDYADNNPVRSMEIRIVGVRKIKDIAEPSLRKFRRKISKDPKVLSLVEYAKYSLDRPKEKAISRSPKRRKSATSKKTKRRKKR